MPVATGYGTSLRARQDCVTHGHVHQPLQRRFLHWREALSWLGHVSSTDTYISELRSFVQVSQMVLRWRRGLTQGCRRAKGRS